MRRFHFVVFISRYICGSVGVFGPGGGMVKPEKMQ